MDNASIVEHARRIMTSASKAELFGSLVEAREFLRVYAGEKSDFYRSLVSIDLTRYDWDYTYNSVRNTLAAFIRYAENGLVYGLSVERRAQIDVVSDILDQAQSLLASKEMHPSAPAVLIGAALEEFLRNWVEDAALPLGNKKPSLDTYCNALREADLVGKQDVKDITSWAGLRNHAAHGEWEEVSDRSRISLMLEGVNLFMRKYGAP